MGDALSESLENYLEAILHIVEERPAARPKDIAARLGVANSSVTGALRALAERGLINYAPFDLITLTPEGQRAARGVARRHGALREFFEVALGLSGAEADGLACRMEHTISGAVLQRVQRFLEFAETCPRLGTEWLRTMGPCGGAGGDPAACQRCVQECAENPAGQRTAAEKAARKREPNAPPKPAAGHKPTGAGKPGAPRGGGAAGREERP